MQRNPLLSGNHQHERPLISVVITTYFRNDRLKTAIDSVLHQTYRPIEVIVVDGSGNEHAEAVVDEHENVQYIAQERDEGAQAARSIGAESATGSYVNFLDDDDRFHPDKLAKQMQVFDHRRGVGVVYCGKTREDGLSMMPDPAVRGAVLDRALSFQMTPSSPSTMLIDATVLREILPLNNRHGADDLGMKIELAQRTEFDFIDESLVIVGDSRQSLGGSMRNVEGRKRILSKYEDLYDRFPPEIRRTAMGYTLMLEAEVILDRSLWSIEAISKIIQGCYYTPGVNWPFIGYLLSALFGRPGRDVGRVVYQLAILDDENRGKIA